jgi:hypothetical protein
MTDMTDTTDLTETMDTTAVGDGGLRFEVTEHDDLALQLDALRTAVEQLRAEVVRLDADLDESRRLNLRAAELLDVVYEELGARRAGDGRV